MAREGRKLWKRPVFYLDEAVLWWFHSLLPRHLGDRAQPPSTPPSEMPPQAGVGL